MVTTEQAQEEIGKYLGVGDGWAGIVLETHIALKELSPNYQPQQIKEKFGGLRYYFDYGDVDKETRHTMDKIVAYAETVCDRTCEICGEPGELDSSDYWMLTLCGAHREARSKGKSARELMEEFRESR